MTGQVIVHNEWAQDNFSQPNQQKVFSTVLAEEAYIIIIHFKTPYDMITEGKAR